MPSTVAHDRDTLTLDDVENPRCPACGHPTYMHRVHGPSTARLAEGDPFPCVAATVSEIIPAGERRAETYRYSYCGCRREFPRAAEIAASTRKVVP
jgi:hypothetical protein